MFWRKEKRDPQLIAVTEMMSRRLKEEILKGNNNKPITVTFTADEFGYLVGYMSTRTGVEL